MSKISTVLADTKKAKSEEVAVALHEFIGRRKNAATMFGSNLAINIGRLLGQYTNGKLLKPIKGGTHQTLGYVSPATFEKRWLIAQNNNQIAA